MSGSSIERVSLEVVELAAAIGMSVDDSILHARALESAGRAAYDAICEVSAGDGAPELRDRAARLRGVVLHGAVLLSELGARAGWFEALARIREVSDVARGSE